MMNKQNLEKLINIVKAKLKKLRVPYLYVGLSNKKGKKLQIILLLPNILSDSEKIKSVHFGDSTSQTYAEGADENKRNAYIARHSKILLKDGTRAIDKKYSPAWFSFYTLW